MEIWSFFTGAMGLDLGLERAGLTPTLAVENDALCRETIAANRPWVRQPLLPADGKGSSPGDVRGICGSAPVREWTPFWCLVWNLLDVRYWFCDCFYEVPWGLCVTGGCEKHD